VDGDEVGEQDGRISEQVGPHTGQAEETIWGHVDISLHRAGFGDEPRRKISGTSVCLFGGVTTDAQTVRHFAGSSRRHGIVSTFHTGAAAVH
jgi:hypothetical protein